MKKINRITILALSTLILTSIASAALAAQNCYGPEAMYGEGPTENCMERAGKTIVSENITAMLEEGVAIPGQHNQGKLVNYNLPKGALFLSGGRYSEGDLHTKRANRAVYSGGLARN